MVKRWSVAAALAFAAIASPAETFRFFGSAGAESQLTPANERSPLNPDNVAAIPYRTNVADATLFADAKTENRALKVHVKLRADSSDRGSDRVEVGEAFVQFSPRPWCDLTVGRVIEKWGTGYAWNPTAFVSPRKNPSDPNDRRSAYRGVGMLRADLFVRGTNVSLYALGGGAFAARGYRLVRGFDVSLHLRHDGDGTRQGISVARVFGAALELHGELARRRALFGAQYTFANGVNVVGELYRSGDGMTAREWREFCDAIDGRSAASLIRANRDYRLLEMGRNYAFVRLAKSDEPRKLDVELLSIASLRDGSALVRLSITRKLTSNLAAYAIETEFLGGGNRELAYVQVRRVTTVGVRMWF